MRRLFLSHSTFDAARMAASVCTYASSTNSFRQLLIVESMHSGVIFK